MAPKRPRPDLDETREALRRHDERVAEDHEAEEEDAKPDEDGAEEAPEP